MSSIRSHTAEELIADSASNYEPLLSTLETRINVAAPVKGQKQKDYDPLAPQNFRAPIFKSKRYKKPKFAHEAPFTPIEVIGLKAAGNEEQEQVADVLAIEEKIREVTSRDISSDNMRDTKKRKNGTRKSLEDKKEPDAADKS